MKAIWIMLFLSFDHTFSTYLNDGCLVQTQTTLDVKVDKSSTFTVHFPLNEKFKLTLKAGEYGNETHSFHLPPGIFQPMKGKWLELQVIYYPLEIKVLNESLKISSKDISDTQQIEIENASILPNCPRGEPLWDTAEMRPKHFLLNRKNKNYLAGIAKDKSIVLDMEINSQKVSINCSSLASMIENICKEVLEFHLNIVRTDATTKVLINDKHFITLKNSTEDTYINVIKGNVYLLQLGQGQNNKTVDCDAKERGDWRNVVLLSISTALVLSIGIICVICSYLPPDAKKSIIPCYGKKRTLAISENNSSPVLPKNTTSKKKNKFAEAPTVGPMSSSTERPPYVIPRNSKESFSESPKRESYYLTIGPNVAYNSKEDRNSGPYQNLQSLCQPMEECPDATNGDYINPNEIQQVKPHEVELLKKENVFQGNVTPAEVERRGTKKGNRGTYIYLDDLIKNTRDNSNLETAEDQQYENTTGMV